MDEEEVQRQLLRAKLICVQTVETVRKLDSMVEDWVTWTETLEKAALGIQLECEAVTEEASTIRNSLSSLSSDVQASRQLWTELGIREENVDNAFIEILHIITSLRRTPSVDTTWLELMEMEMRIERISRMWFGLITGVFRPLKEQVRASTVNAAIGTSIGGTSTLTKENDNK